MNEVGSLNFKYQHEGLLEQIKTSHVQVPLQVLETQTQIGVCSISLEDKSAVKEPEHMAGRPLPDKNSELQGSTPQRIDADTDLNTVKAICDSVYKGSDRYCRIDDILSPSFWDSLIADYPRLMKSWRLNIIVGEDFDHSETNYTEQIPSCDQFIVFKLQRLPRPDSFVRLF